MSKTITLHELPDEAYWNLKREKDESKYNNWTAFFLSKTDEREYINEMNTIDPHRANKLEEIQND